MADPANNVALGNLIAHMASAGYQLQSDGSFKPRAAQPVAAHPVQANSTAEVDPDVGNFDLPSRKPINMTFGTKPPGTAGRKKKGFNLQKALRMTKEHFSIFRRGVKIILMRTDGIDMNKALSHQKEMYVKRVIYKVRKAYPETEEFAKENDWATRCMAYLILKASSDAYREKSGLRKRKPKKNSELPAEVGGNDGGNKPVDHTEPEDRSSSPPTANAEPNSRSNSPPIAGTTDARSRDHMDEMLAQNMSSIILADPEPDDDEDVNMEGPPQSILSGLTGADSFIKLPTRATTPPNPAPQSHSKSASTAGPAGKSAEAPTSSAPALMPASSLASAQDPASSPRENDLGSIPADILTPGTRAKLMKLPPKYQARLPPIALLALGKKVKPRPKMRPVPDDSDAEDFDDTSPTSPDPPIPASKSLSDSEDGSEDDAEAEATTRKATKTNAKAGAKAGAKGAAKGGAKGSTKGGAK
ncbi:hypothetical protein FRC07_006072, partial [Ceratobasidium sp. 392]